MWVIFWARKPQNSTVVKDTGPPSALSRALKGKGTLLPPDFLDWKFRAIWLWLWSK